VTLSFTSRDSGRDGVGIHLIHDNLAVERLNSDLGRDGVLAFDKGFDLAVLGVDGDFLGDGFIILAFDILNDIAVVRLDRDFLGDLRLALEEVVRGVVMVVAVDDLRFDKLATLEEVVVPGGKVVYIISLLLVGVLDSLVRELTGNKPDTVDVYVACV